MKTIVAFFEIPAVDFDRAVGFYQTLFGVEFNTLDCGHEKMAFFPDKNGICPGAVSWAEKESFLPSENGVLVSLNVADMKQSISIIEKNGGRIVIPKTKIEAENRGYFAVFIDCEGNRVGLYSER
jgi:predicted enzyme related to lactoylglutathione lyase